jgi:dCTP deaminase
MAWRRGVLSDKQIRALIENGAILNAEPQFTRDSGLINPSSLDVRVGYEQIKLLGSTLPLEGQSIDETLARVIDFKHKGREDFYLEGNNRPYVSRLIEELNLPDTVSGRLFNKSGRARIGISALGLTNGNPQFDHIQEGYSGPVWAELYPTAFSIILRPGETSIPQIRFYEGGSEHLRNADLEHVLKHDPILTDNAGNPMYSETEKERIIRSGVFWFKADFRGDIQHYKERRVTTTLDLSEKEKYDPFDFFEPVRERKSTQDFVVIPADEFVLIKSLEHVRIPYHLAAEIVAHSPQFEDMRVSYAHLINSGHGYFSNREELKPSHIIFEVRARDKPVIIKHGQPLAGFYLLHMSEEPEQKYMENRSTDFNDLRSFLPGIFMK